MKDERKRKMQRLGKTGHSKRETAVERWERGEEWSRPRIIVSVLLFCPVGDEHLCYDNGIINHTHKHHTQTNAYIHTNSDHYTSS